MADPPGPPPFDGILGRLLLRGATEVRAVRELGWLVGHAPSGVAFELHYWLTRGYSVTRRLLQHQPAELLGVFAAWEDAVERALQA
jgi:hypothetical protein